MINLDHKNDRCQAPYGKIQLPNILLYFSYDTIVAAYYKGSLYHLHNSWGPTTGKHMNKMFSRDHSKEVDDLDQIIKEALVTYGLDHVKDRLNGKETN